MSGTLFALQMLAVGLPTRSVLHLGFSKQVTKKYPHPSAQVLLPMAWAGSYRDHDQEWCSRELGLQGDCIGHFRCLCICYEMEATPPQVSTAYFGEVWVDRQLHLAACSVHRLTKAVQQ